jgi:hypothetical protein
MYGGLFGDLPAAKKKGGTRTTAVSSLAPGSNHKEKEEEEEAKEYSSVKDATKEDENEETAPNESLPLSSSWLASVDRKRIKKNNDDSSSMITTQQKQQQQPSSSGSNRILQTVGRAGTSMTFVPTAALKRKKPTSNHRIAKPVETTLKDGAVPTTTTTAAEVQQQDGRLASQEEEQIPKIENNAVASASASLQHEMTVTTTTVVRSTFQQPSQTSEVINIHGDDITFALDSTANVSNPQPMAHHVDTDTTTSQQPPPPAAAYRPQHHVQQHQDDNNETEEITDPYDPYFPNDLLQYWERQAAAEERARLEQETKQAMERQRLLREELNREREHQQRLGGAAASSTDRGGGTLMGNPAATISGIGSRGRGRGGVSNLPAWLVEKQRQEAETTLGKDATANTVNDDHFAPSSS